ncbi:MAG TPA: hypothetical protein VJR89_02135, partial [Polyangiales bacterium]|nr:hypothetical protein [Polyangiales bacterium]
MIEDAGTAQPDPLWQAISCIGNNPRLFADLVKLTRNVDYLALYRTQPPGFGGSTQIAFAIPVDTQGTACSASTDRAACDAKLAMLAAPSAKCQEQRMCGPFALLTHKDELQRLEKPDDGAFLELLGTIDTPAKAVLAAFWEGLYLGCPKYFGGTTQVTLHGTEVSKQNGRWVVRSEWEACGPMSRDTMTLDEAGNVLSMSHEDLGRSGCVVGRRPAGLQAASPRAMPSALGAFLAGNARLEAASVWAFERLASELRELGAPASMIWAARDAAQDEQRHTQLVTQLARSYGAEPSEPRIAD